MVPFKQSVLRHASGPVSWKWGLAFLTQFKTGTGGEEGVVRGSVRGRPPAKQLRVNMTTTTAAAAAGEVKARGT